MKQEGPRTFVYQGDEYEVGGFNPLDPTDKSIPALDIRHMRVLLNLLDFLDPIELDRTIKFSITKLTQNMGDGSSKCNGRDVIRNRRLLSDLSKCYIRIRKQGDPVFRSYRLLEAFNPCEKPARRSGVQSEIWIDKATFSPEFFQFITDRTELLKINLDVLNGFKGAFVQSLYIYLPAPAFHCTEENPFRIRMTTTLERVGKSVPKAKSKRKDIFVKHGENSVLNQLDGALVSCGRLRCRIEDTKDEKDYNLCLWTERRHKRIDKNDSKLLKAWKKSGRGADSFHEKIKKPLSLDGLDYKYLAAARVDPAGSERFLAMVKGLIGENQFHGIIAELKNDLLDPAGSENPVMSPTKILNFRLTQHIKSNPNSV